MLELVQFAKDRPRFIQSGLKLYLDASDQRSYNGGSQWNDLSGNNNHIAFTGPIVKEGAFLHGNAINSFGRTINTFDLTNKRAVTIFCLMKHPDTGTAPAIDGIVYEHTPDWNAGNTYGSVTYGGFGVAMNTSGTAHLAHGIHAQYQGNSPYSGVNILSPDITKETLYTFIHDTNQVTPPQSKAYINAVEFTGEVGIPYNGISNQSMGNDYLFLWTRGGVGSFNDTRIALMLIYDRVLSLSEIQYTRSILLDRFTL
jgi:hypothetical protein